MNPASDLPPLLLALTDPATLTKLDDSSWQDLLDVTRHNGLLAKLAAIAHDRGVLPQISDRARAHLEEALLFVNHHQTTIRFEVNRLVRALSHLEVPIVLLKGGAYLMADLPPARGRFMSDLDIMVPKNKIGFVEETLFAEGWERVTLTKYDEHSFRDWMQEIPPIRHSERRVATDIHHTIVPVTSRYRPDTEALFSAAVPLKGPFLRVLSPADMVLHSAVHLFNEEFLLGLRDLVDLHELLEYFGKSEHFWDDLLDRSHLHGLGRILYYLLRDTRRIFGTEIPAYVEMAAQAQAPNMIVRTIMDLLVMSALKPSAPGQAHPGRAIALWFLYIRSHWLTMPPLLLARHLLVKAFYRWRATLKATLAKTESKAN